MHYFRKSLIKTIALPCLVVLGASCLPAIAHANPQPIKQPFLISRLLPKKTAFDCGNMGAITLTREPANHDRFTYEAVNTRGQTLTIKNGVGYGDNTSTIYTFVGKDGSEFIVEEFPTGKATLTTAGKGGVNSTSFNCTVMKASGTAVSESAASSSSSRSASESSSSVSKTRSSETRITIIRTRSVAKPIPKPALPTTTGEVRGLW